MIRAIIAAVVLLLLGVTAGLYIHSTHALLRELISDSRRADVQGFDARVDWDALRANLKAELTEKKKSLGSNGASIGPALSEIGKVVDYYIQPGNIGVAYYFHTDMFPTIKEEDFISSSGYAFPFGYQITLGYPKGIPANDIPKLILDRMKVKLVFRLDGLTWKLKEIEVPLFMTPQQVPGQPLTELYGSAKN
ncbi:MAG: DUF2939 domain-containing protein [Alphaproteobacteria bacterium]|nr:DUF2939 domain-containing protein [Alphaproteobacteria bacterium]